jgi:hypothetical protein
MKPKSNSPDASLPLSHEFIKRRIFIVRGHEVMLDADLAELYQVPTKRLNEAVRRNKSRFPEDFMFRISASELRFLNRSQIVTGSLRSQFATLENSLIMRSQFATASKRNIRFNPFAFTEHGVAMLSSILKSKRAIAMNIFIIRAFIQLRKMLANHQELSKRLQKVEEKVSLYGEVLTSMVEDIKRFKNPPKINAIGFRWKPKTKI